MRNRPVPSITVAPGGTWTPTAGPTAVIMPSRTTTVRPDNTSSEVIGRMVTPVNAVGPGMVWASPGAKVVIARVAASVACCRGFMLCASFFRGK